MVEPLRIGRDLILARVAAHGIDLGNAGYAA